MKLREIAAPDFDLAMTLNSGQVFHWEKQGHGFLGAIGETPVYVQQDGRTLNFAGLSAKAIVDYFALDHPLDEICATFPKDAAMNSAREFCRGLRIIRQPTWECLATFICSSMKQVAHIRQISAALRRRFGTAKKIVGCNVFTFPAPARLARTSESDLRACALGYRARNLLMTARQVASDVPPALDFAGGSSSLPPTGRNRLHEPLRRRINEITMDAHGARHLGGVDVLGPPARADAVRELHGNARTVLTTAAAPSDEDDGGLALSRNLRNSGGP